MTELSGLGQPDYIGQRREDTLLLSLGPGDGCGIISHDMPEHKLEFVQPVIDIFSPGLCRRV
jgi:hypothetical protein